MNVERFDLEIDGELYSKSILIFDHLDLRSVFLSLVRGMEQQERHGTPKCPPFFNFSFLFSHLFLLRNHILMSLDMKKKWVCFYFIDSSFDLFYLFIF